MTIKKIFNIIRNNYRKSISYQAVHKAIYELLDEKVLVKRGKEYSLNKDYIERLSHFIGRLKLNYKEEKSLFKELSQKNFVTRKKNAKI